MLFITKLYHRTKYLFNKKKRIENLQWIVIGVRRRSRVRFIPWIETTTKTKDTAETETISPWSSKHSNNTRQYESSSSRPSYVLIVIVGFRALEHLYLSESFLKCCIEFASWISHTLVLSLNIHRTNHSTTYYSWFKIMKHYFSLILKSYSLSLSLSLCEILVRDSQIIFFLLDPLLSIWLCQSPKCTVYVWTNKNGGMSMIRR